MGEKCGTASVQGPNYNGIGAFPFVARIGFRSNQVWLLLECTYIL